MLSRRFSYLDHKSTIKQIKQYKTKITKHTAKYFAHFEKGHIIL